MKTLFIEGSSGTDNGDVRKAFRLLLEKELQGNMPRIFMCDGQKHTIDTFFSSPMQKDEQRFMLFDSDMPSPDKQAICAASNKSFKKTSHFRHARKHLPDDSRSRAIHKPCEKLAELYKKSGKTYTKVNEFAKIFPKLDTTKLKQTCSEFKALIEALK